MQSKCYKCGDRELRLASDIVFHLDVACWSLSARELLDGNNSGPTRREK